MIIEVEEDRSGVVLGIDEELKFCLIGIVFCCHMPEILVKG